MVTEIQASRKERGDVPRGTSGPKMPVERLWRCCAGEWKTRLKLGSVPRGTLWLLQGEEAVLGAGNREAEGSFGCGLRGEGHQPAAGSDAQAGGGEGLLHAVDGAQGHGGEEAAGRQRLHAVGPDLGCEAQRADGLAEEAGLLALGLGQRDAECGEQKLDGQAGKASAGAEVQQRGLGGK
jgi:hypothetical protein